MEKPAAVDPMIASIRAHLKEVRAELLRDEDKSLDLAVTRLLASKRWTQVAGCSSCAGAKCQRPWREMPFDPPG